MPESTDRGALTEAVFYILLALFKPTHGYGIMKFIKTTTNGRVILGSGTLYGAINTLLKNGWIQIETIQDDSRKCYVITELGRRMVESEKARLKELVAHSENITRGDYRREDIL
jgi:DNA-binding PadR family transcriptional regulator